MAECWHSDSKSPTIAGVSSDSLTDRYCLTDIHRPHLWSWQLEDSNLDSNNLDSLAGLQMCTWARVGSHGHETALCRMEDRSWWCWNAVCAILTFYFCLDYLSGNSCLALVSSYRSFCKSESVLSMQSGFTPMNLWEDCAVLCHWSHSSTLSTMKIQSPMSLWHHLPLECSCVVTFSAHGTSDLPMWLEHLRAPPGRPQWNVQLDLQT